MAQSTISKVDELEKLYRLPDAGKVKAFLSERPELLDILLEARPEIEMQFGKGVVVVLRFPRYSWWGDVTARPESRPLHIGIEFNGGTWLMTFQWEEYLFLAKELSRKGGEAATRSAISRAYYAAYQIARQHKGAKRVSPLQYPVLPGPDRCIRRRAFCPGLR